MFKEIKKQLATLVLATVLPVYFIHNAPVAAEKINVILDSLDNIQARVGQ